MKSASVFEDFSSEVTAGEPERVEMTFPQAESQAKLSFDEGYTCGWKDGVASMEDRDARVLEEISSSLQELNFTYFEARQHVVVSVRPLLQSMVDTLLPRMASASLGARVSELLSDVANQFEPVAQLMCAPDCVEIMRDVVAQHSKFSIEVIAEPTFTTSQATLSIEDTQFQLDLDETISEVQNCIDDFFSQPEDQKEARRA